MNTSEHKRTILIVDDNPTNVHMLIDILKERYATLVALSGDAALKTIESGKKIDLILLDIMMPVIDGFETCKKIKESENASDVPIIFLTANNDVESLTNAFRVGGVDYVTKPFNEIELLSRINTHITLKESKDKLKDLNKWLETEIAIRNRELIQSNHQLQIAQKELEYIDSIKGDFLNAMSHEIRTPLNGIIGSTQFLTELNQSEEASLFLGMLQESVRRLELFSIKSLDVTYLRANVGTLKCHKYSLRKIVRDSVKNIEPRILKKKIIIDVVDHLSDDMIVCHDEYMVKCFENILENSIKFSIENSTITMVMEDKKDVFNIRIMDAGVGFDDSFLNQPITMFCKTKVQTAFSPGLGLYLAKLVIDAHHGIFRIGNNKLKNNSYNYSRGAFVEMAFQRNHMDNTAFMQLNQAEAEFN